jgi:hypothetical protein
MQIILNSISFIVHAVSHFDGNWLEIAVVLILALAVRTIPLLQSANGLCLAGICCSGFIFGINTLWLYLNAIVVLLVLMAIGQLKSRWAQEKSHQLLMLVLVACFVIFSLQAEPLPGFVLILNMITFLKFLVMIWEFASGRIESVPWNVYLAWIGLPFISIFVRLSDFKSQLDNGPVVPKPIDRAFLGDSCIRCGMMATAYLLGMVGEKIPRAGVATQLLHLYILSPWGWYLQAAAFSGLLRNGGALSGIIVPENFRSPFLSTNISDFWSRWNIAGTLAFRDMLFFNRFGLPFHNVYLSSMIVFLAVGAWHSINAYWLIWGLLHGLGFCCYIAIGSKLHLGNSRWKPFMGWAVTYGFVCTCWALPPQCIKLWKAIMFESGG